MSGSAPKCSRCGGRVYPSLAHDGEMTESWERLPAEKTIRLCWICLHWVGEGRLGHRYCTVGRERVPTAYNHTCGMFEPNTEEP